MNGSYMDKDIILHDKDSCTFFLLDGQGNMIERSSQEDEEFLWEVRFKDRNGKIWSKTLNGNGCVCGFSIHPDSFNVMFHNGKALASVGYGICDSEGEVTCLFKGRYYGIPVKLDVLPPEPKVEIVEQQIIYFEELPLFTVKLKITANEAKSGVLFVSIPYNNTWISEAIDTKVPMPFYMTVDYGYEESGYWCQVNNAYGVTGSDIVFPDWSSTAIQNTMDDKSGVRISSDNGFCHISSNETMRYVNIVDMNGRMTYSAADVTDTNVMLDRGLYIVKVTDKSGKRIINKVLIK